MRKRIIGTDPPASSEAASDWLALDQIATAEVTSEETAHPVENALLRGSTSGWRSALPGAQTIRLVFDAPQALRRVHLLFAEPDVEREQEYVLRWSGDGGKTYRDIVRQQWNFNPRSSAQEVEDYTVELSGVTHLELTIVPNRSGGDARATLEQLRLA